MPIKFTDLISVKIHPYVKGNVSSKITNRLINLLHPVGNSLEQNKNKKQIAAAVMVLENKYKKNNDPKIFDALALYYANRSESKRLSGAQAEVNKGGDKKHLVDNMNFTVKALTDNILHSMNNPLIRVNIKNELRRNNISAKDNIRLISKFSKLNKRLQWDNKRSESCSISEKMTELERKIIENRKVMIKSTIVFVRKNVHNVSRKTKDYLMKYDALVRAYSPLSDITKNSVLGLDTFSAFKEHESNKEIELINLMDIFTLSEVIKEDSANLKMMDRTA